MVDEAADAARYGCLHQRNAMRIAKLAECDSTAQPEAHYGQAGLVFRFFDTNSQIDYD